MKSKIIMFLAVSVISFCVLSQANAEELTAMVSNIVGTVEVIRAGEVEAIPAKSGMTLNVDDTVKTGSDSSVTVTFLPMTFIQLTSNTEIRIEENLLNDETFALNAKLDLLSGHLRAIIRDLPPESLFEIKSPTAVAAVRGTICYVGSDGEIYVEEGSVTVINLLTGEMFTVFAGQFTVIREDGTVETPREPSAEEIEGLVGDFVRLEVEPYEPPERPGIVITPNVLDPFDTPASEF